MMALVAVSFLSAPLMLANKASAQQSSQDNMDQKNMQQQVKNITAFGTISNNQIQEGKVSWIQSGGWKLQIKAQNDSMSGSFIAKFVMVKPDGTSLHKHSIKNYVSETVSMEGGELAMVGKGDIYSDNTLKYSQVPITVHIMGKSVLGLIIDTKKTESHFAGSSELYGIVTRPGKLGEMLKGGYGKMNMEPGMKMNNTMSSSAPSFDNIRVTKISKTSAMVEGTTSIPVMCQVEYGKDASNMDRTATDGMTMKSMHKIHSVMLNNLEPDTTYSYRFKATMNGQTVYSDIMTFTTLKG